MGFFQPIFIFKNPILIICQQILYSFYHFQDLRLLKWDQQQNFDIDDNSSLDFSNRFKSSSMIFTKELERIKGNFKGPMLKIKTFVILTPDF